MNSFLSQNVWTNYGLMGNPFNTKALSLEENTSLPITKTFVGRGADSRESRFITNILRNPGGARFVVEGEIGVGKTSFVNFHRALWEKEAIDKLLTPEEEISVCRDWKLRDFLVNILGALIKRIRKLPRGFTLIEGDPVLRQIALLNEIYQRETLEFSLSVMGTGGSLGKQETIHVPQIPEVQLNSYFHYLVQRIRSWGFAGVFIHLDNLELISRIQVEKAQLLFEDLRDTLQTRDVYFALVGQRGFFQDVIAPRERLKSVFFGRPIILPPLSREEVQAAVEKRYELLRLPEKKLVYPFPISFIDYLYDIYRGKIRFIMEAINTLIPSLPPKTPATLSFKDARFKLKEILTENLMENITPQEWEALRLAVSKEFFTNLDISKKLGMAAPNVSRMIKNLLGHHLISLYSKEGRNIYYQAHEDVRIILDTYKPTFVSMSQGEKFTNTKRRIEMALKTFQNQITFTAREYASLVKISLSTARNDLAALLEKGMVEKTGKGRGTCYKII